MMPEEQPKPTEEAKPQAGGQPAANPSATPTPEAAAAPPADAAAPKPASRIPADPLSDGTVPTVLAEGDAAKHDVPTTGKSTLTSIYRRADIMTTLFTFGGAIIAAALIFGGYLYFTKPKTVATTKKSTVTNLDAGDLTKLGDFFNADSAGSAQVLTVNSASLFKGRVALSQDLKVLGAISAGGPTQLSDLTVNATSTLGVTSVRGALTVSGPLNLQSPATLGAGGTVTGNLAVSGNGSFGGTLSAGLLNITNLEVLGTLTLAGHITITSPSVTATPNDGAGAGATATVDGNDTTGTVTITTGTIPSSINTSGEELGQVNFHTAYGKVPHVIITPVGSNGSSINYYVEKTDSMFMIGTSTNARSNTTYTYDYWVAQ